eukprot:2534094-Amphidinium_carterae.1
MDQCTEETHITSRENWSRAALKIYKIIEYSVSIVALLDAPLTPPHDRFFNFPPRRELSLCKRSHGFTRRSSNASFQLKTPLASNNHTCRSEVYDATFDSCTTTHSPPDAN